jgi:hypothetical protein
MQAIQNLLTEVDVCNLLVETWLRKIITKFTILPLKKVRIHKHEEYFNPEAKKGVHTTGSGSTTMNIPMSAHSACLLN